jgi:Pyruvate/2-oxoacid:ferredoxin oxidoreductase gamma subunit
MLGAYVGATGILPRDAVEAAIADEFRDGRERHILANVLAFRVGLEAGSADEVHA